MKKLLMILLLLNTGLSFGGQFQFEVIANYNGECEEDICKEDPPYGQGDMFGILRPEAPLASRFGLFRHAPINDAILGFAIQSDDGAVIVVTVTSIDSIELATGRITAHRSLVGVLDSDPMNFELTADGELLVLTANGGIWAMKAKDIATAPITQRVAPQVASAASFVRLQEGIRGASYVLCQRDEINNLSRLFLASDMDPAFPLGAPFPGAVVEMMRYSPPTQPWVKAIAVTDTGIIFEINEAGEFWPASVTATPATRMAAFEDEGELNLVLVSDATGELLLEQPYQGSSQAIFEPKWVSNATHLDVLPRMSTRTVPVKAVVESDYRLRVEDAITGEILPIASGMESSAPIGAEFDGGICACGLSSAMTDIQLLLAPATDGQGPVERAGRIEAFSLLASQTGTPEKVR